MPGVTAGVAAAAYAGIPVTHRGASSAVAFVTGHEDPTSLSPRSTGPALGAFPGTLVFYMGVGHLPAIATSLTAAGRSRASRRRRSNAAHCRDSAWCGDIGDDRAARAAGGHKAPRDHGRRRGGDLAEELAWRDPRPLSGRTVAVTRARSQASGLARRLSELGAERDRGARDPHRAAAERAAGPSPYNLICLTSPNGVDALFERLAADGRDARALANARVAAIGPGTARALSEHGIAADVVPERFVAEALVEALADIPVKRALIARASEARDVLPDALRARGAEVDVLALYETVAEPLAARTGGSAGADYITFTSSSTVRFFLDAAGENALSPGMRVVSIGPVTSATLREHGIEPHVEAGRHDIDGVVDALLADALSAAA